MTQFNVSIYMEKYQQNPSSFFYCVFCDENTKSGKGTYDFHYQIYLLHKQGLLFSVSFLTWRKLFAIQLLTECKHLCKSLA